MSDVAILPQWLAHVAQFASDCHDCRQELPPHWQHCVQCDIRFATYCCRCGTPLPPAGSYACAQCNLPIPWV